MLPLLRKIVLWGLGALVLGYVIFCVVLRTRFRALAYDIPYHAAPIPPPGASMLTLRADDGVVVHSLEIPPPNGSAPVLVVFHGNGESIGDWCDIAEAFRARGFGVVISEYRGSGVSHDVGEPSEAGLYSDAAAVVAAVRAEGVARARVVLLGESLGTGVAAEIARRGEGGALVLISPYTSMVELGKHTHPLLPISLIVTERFDTLSKAPYIRMPTLIVHGDADEQVPFAMGRTLADAIPGAEIHVVPGGHHEDLWHLWLWRKELVETIGAFARSVAAREKGASSL
jgi:fermentation-respiration switch protein FrsA (DUF1100 family)